MPVPTHGPQCEKLFCYPSRCADCKQDVFYWGCTCGSRVLFDDLGEPWPTHECGKKRLVVPLRTYPPGQPTRDLDETNPMLRVRCEICGEKVRRGRMEEHKRVVHRRVKKVVAGSLDFDDCYDEEALRKTLSQSLGVRVGIERKGDWGLSSVPTLRVDGSWRDDYLDVYWHAFTRFCRWPVWKENARLEVYDADPALDRWDARRILLFYRSDLRQLSMAVKTENQLRAESKVVSGVSLQEVCRLRTFRDAMRMKPGPPS